jgi:hypothetical protein
MGPVVLLDGGAYDEHADGGVALLGHLQNVRARASHRRQRRDSPVAASGSSGRRGATSSAINGDGPIPSSSLTVDR